jgi:hypothetical protein
MSQAARLFVGAGFKPALLTALLLTTPFGVACSDDDDDSAKNGKDGGGGDDDGSGRSGRGGSSGSGASGRGGSGASGDGGPTSGDGGQLVDGGAIDPEELPPPADCARFGDECSASGTCCSGLCDPTSNTCASSIVQCGGDGDACAAATDCCNLLCDDGGHCAAGTCVSDGEACTADGECCGRSCADDKCVALNLSCKTAGNACTGNEQCCSSLCKDGTCALSASFCIQAGDICARAEDCCTGRCTIADGENVGVCADPPTGASFCNGGVEGSVCGECNDCCSRLCAPYGANGVKVCQPASGCHVTGDFCREDRDCCGADGTGLPGEGHVHCEKQPDADLGICRNPNACNPQGNVCHYKDYACGVSSARANCCGGLGAKGGVCQLDGLGVPRCNGLGDTCRMTGDTCASADDCCDDRPCVPDAEGVLRCYDTPPDTNCVPKTGPCTINADCCPGTLCVRPVGSTVGACGDNSGGAGGSGGAGTSGSGGAGNGGTGGDGPTCAEYGQQCSQASDCCNSVPCDNGVCRYPLI